MSGSQIRYSSTQCQVEAPMSTKIPPRQVNTCPRYPPPRPNLATNTEDGPIRQTRVPRGGSGIHVRSRHSSPRKSSRPNPFPLQAYSHHMGKDPLPSPLIIPARSPILDHHIHVHDILMRKRQRRRGRHARSPAVTNLLGDFLQHLAISAHRSPSEERGPWGQE